MRNITNNSIQNDNITTMRDTAIIVIMLIIAAVITAKLIDAAKLNLKCIIQQNPLLMAATCIICPAMAAKIILYLASLVRGESVEERFVQRSIQVTALADQKQALKHPLDAIENRIQQYHASADPGSEIPQEYKGLVKTWADKLTADIMLENPNFQQLTLCTTEEDGAIHYTKIDKHIQHLWTLAINSAMAQKHGKPPAQLVENKLENLENMQVKNILEKTLELINQDIVKAINFMMFQVRTQSTNLNLACIELQNMANSHCMLNQSKVAIQKQIRDLYAACNTAMKASRYYQINAAGGVVIDHTSLVDEKIKQAYEQTTQVIHDEQNQLIQQANNKVSRINYQISDIEWRLQTMKYCSEYMNIQSALQELNFTKEDVDHDAKSIMKIYSERAKSSKNPINVAQNKWIKLMNALRKCMKLVTDHQQVLMKLSQSDSYSKDSEKDAQLVAVNVDNEILLQQNTACSVCEALDDEFAKISKFDEEIGLDELYNQFISAHKLSKTKLQELINQLYDEMDKHFKTGVFQWFSSKEHDLKKLKQHLKECTHKHKTLTFKREMLQTSADKTSPEICVRLNWPNKNDAAFEELYKVLQYNDKQFEGLRLAAEKKKKASKKIVKKHAQHDLNRGNKPNVRKNPTIGPTKNVSRADTHRKRKNKRKARHKAQQVNN